MEFEIKKVINKKALLFLFLLRLINQVRSYEITDNQEQVFEMSHLLRKLDFNTT